MNRISPAYKIIAVFTALCLECTSILIPTARAELISPIVPSIKKLNPELLKLPVKFGEVVESHSGKGNVIIIQDAHAIPDAQKNIANVIKFVQKEYGVETIALEGASGDLDPQIFRSFPDKKILRQVMKGYMDVGEIAGGTAAAVFDETPTKYVGVEDWDVYEEGLGLYLSAMEKETELLEKLNAERLKLNAEKEKVYSKELLGVDQAVEKFYENAEQLTDLIKLLGAVQAPQAGSELDALWKEVNKGQETGDTLRPSSGQARQETKDIEVREIAGRVEKFLRATIKAESPQGLPEASPGVAQRGKQDALKVFNARKQEWMTGAISPEAFAMYLKETAEKFKIRIEMSSELHGMVRDQQTLKSLEGTKLFRDLELYVRDVKQQLIQGSNGTNAERITTNATESVKRQALSVQLESLDQRTESLRTLTKLSKLELSREEWKQLKLQMQFQRATNHGPRATKENDSTADNEALTTNSSERGPWLVEHGADLFVFHLAFYLNAEERDEIFFKNLAGNGKRGTGNETQIIVAGGFHAEGLTSRLKAAGMGYALVMPKINHIPESLNYRAQMRGEVSWKDYFEVENGRIHLYKAFVRATRDQLLRADGTTYNVNRTKSDEVRSTNYALLKSWRDQIIRDLSDKGQVQRAVWYTRYMDEVIDQRSADSVKRSDDLLMKVDDFIRGLRGLEKANQLNSTQVAALLKANMIQAVVVGSQQLQSDGGTVTVFPHALKAPAHSASRSAEALIQGAGYDPGNFTIEQVDDIYAQLPNLTRDQHAMLFKYIWGKFAVPHLPNERLKNIPDSLLEKLIDQETKNSDPKKIKSNIGLARIALGFWNMTIQKFFANNLVLTPAESEYVWAIFHNVNPDASNRTDYLTSSEVVENILNKWKPGQPKVHLLDLGAGPTAAALNTLVDKYGKEVAAHGIDLAPDENSDSPIDLRKGNILNLVELFGKDQMDIIYDSFALDYIPDDKLEEALIQIVSVLKEGGVFVSTNFPQSYEFDFKAFASKLTDSSVQIGGDNGEFIIQRLARSEARRGSPPNGADSQIAGVARIMLIVLLGGWLVSLTADMLNAAQEPPAVPIVKAVQLPAALARALADPNSLEKLSELLDAYREMLEKNPHFSFTDQANRDAAVRYAFEKRDTLLPILIEYFNEIQKENGRKAPENRILMSPYIRDWEGSEIVARLAALMGEPVEQRDIEAIGFLVNFFYGEALQIFSPNSPIKNPSQKILSRMIKALKNRENGPLSRASGDLSELLDLAVAVPVPIFGINHPNSMTVDLLIGIITNQIREENLTGIELEVNEDKQGRKLLHITYSDIDPNSVSDLKDEDVALDLINVPALNPIPLASIMDMKIIEKTLWIVYEKKLANGKREVLIGRFPSSDESKLREWATQRSYGKYREILELPEPRLPKPGESMPLEDFVRNVFLILESGVYNLFHFGFNEDGGVFHQVANRDGDRIEKQIEDPIVSFLKESMSYEPRAKSRNQGGERPLPSTNYFPNGMKIERFSLTPSSKLLAEGMSPGGILVRGTPIKGKFSDEEAIKAFGEILIENREKLNETLPPGYRVTKDGIKVSPITRYTADRKEGALSFEVDVIVVPIGVSDANFASPKRSRSEMRGDVSELEKSNEKEALEFARVLFARAGIAEPAGPPGLLAIFLGELFEKWGFGKSIEIQERTLDTFIKAAEEALKTRRELNKPMDLTELKNKLFYIVLSILFGLHSVIALVGYMFFPGLLVTLAFLLYFFHWHEIVVVIYRVVGILSKWVSDVQLIRKGDSRSEENEKNLTESLKKLNQFLTQANFEKFEIKKIPRAFLKFSSKPARSSPLELIAGGAAFEFYRDKSDDGQAAGLFLELTPKQITNLEDAGALDRREQVLAGQATQYIKKIIDEIPTIELYSPGSAIQPEQFIINQLKTNHGFGYDYPFRNKKSHFEIWEEPSIPNEELVVKFVARHLFHRAGFPAPRGEAGFMVGLLIDLLEEMKWVQTVEMRKPTLRDLEKEAAMRVEERKKAHELPRSIESKERLFYRVLLGLFGFSAVVLAAHLNFPKAGFLPTLLRVLIQAQTILGIYAIFSLSKKFILNARLKWRVYFRSEEDEKKLMAALPRLQTFLTRANEMNFNLERIPFFFLGPSDKPARNSVFELIAEGAAFHFYGDKSGDGHGVGLFLELTPEQIKSLTNSAFIDRMDVTRQSFMLRHTKIDQDGVSTLTPNVEKSTLKPGSIVKINDLTDGHGFGFNYPPSKNRSESRLMQSTLDDVGADSDFEKAKETLRIMNLTGGEITQHVYSAGGTYLFVRGHDSNPKPRLISLRDGQLIPLPEDLIPESVRFSPDEKILIAKTTQGMRLFFINKEGLIKIDAPPYSGSVEDRPMFENAEISADGKTFIFQDGRSHYDPDFHVYRFENGSFKKFYFHYHSDQLSVMSENPELLAPGEIIGFLKRFRGSGDQENEDSIKSVTFSPDGKMALVVSHKGRSGFFNLESKSPIIMPLEQEQFVTQKAFFSPDNKKVIAMNVSGNVQFFSIDGLEFKKINEVGKLFHGLAPDTPFQWSANSQYIILTRSDSAGVFRLQFSEDAPESLDYKLTRVEVKDVGFPLNQIVVASGGNEVWLSSSDHQMRILLLGEDGAKNQIVNFDSQKKTTEVELKRNLILLTRTEPGSEKEKVLGVVKGDQLFELMRVRGDLENLEAWMEGGILRVKKVGLETAYLLVPTDSESEPFILEEIKMPESGFKQFSESPDRKFILLRTKRGSLLMRSADMATDRMRELIGDARWGWTLANLLNAFLSDGQEDAPEIQSFEDLNEVEKKLRSFFSGLEGFMTPQGESIDRQKKLAFFSLVARDESTVEKILEKMEKGQSLDSTASWEYLEGWSHSFLDSLTPEDFKYFTAVHWRLFHVIFALGMQVQYEDKKRAYLLYDKKSQLQEWLTKWEVFTSKDDDFKRAILEIVKQSFDQQSDFLLQSTSVSERDLERHSQILNDKTDIIFSLEGKSAIPIIFKKRVDLFLSLLEKFNKLISFSRANSRSMYEDIEKIPGIAHRVLGLEPGHELLRESEVKAWMEWKERLFGTSSKEPTRTEGKTDSDVALGKFLDEFFKDKDEYYSLDDRLLPFSAMERFAVVNPFQQGGSPDYDEDSSKESMVAEKKNHIDWHVFGVHGLSDSEFFYLYEEIEEFYKNHGGLNGENPAATSEEWNGFYKSLLDKLHRSYRHYPDAFGVVLNEMADEWNGNYSDLFYVLFRARAGRDFLGFKATREKDDELIKKMLQSSNDKIVIFGLEFAKHLDKTEVEQADYKDVFFRALEGLLDQGMAAQDLRIFLNYFPEQINVNDKQRAFELIQSLIVKTKILEPTAIVSEDLSKDLFSLFERLVRNGHHEMIQILDKALAASSVEDMKQLSELWAHFVNLFYSAKPETIAAGLRVAVSANSDITAPMNLELAQYLIRHAIPNPAFYRDPEYRKALNELANFLGREKNSGPAEERINEDTRTSLFNLLAQLSKAELLSLKEEIFEKFFYISPEAYPIPMHDLLSLFEYLSFEEAQVAIQNVLKNNRPYLSDMKTKLDGKIQARARRDEIQNQLQDQILGQLTLMFSNLFVLQGRLKVVDEIMDKIKATAVSSAESTDLMPRFKTLLEGLRKIASDYDAPRTFDKILSIATTAEVDFNQLIRLKWESLPVVQREDFLIGALRWLDGAQEEKKGQAKALVSQEIRGQMLGFINKQFEFLPESSRLRILLKIMLQNKPTLAQFRLQVEGFAKNEFRFTMEKAFEKFPVQAKFVSQFAGGRQWATVFNAVQITEEDDERRKLIENEARQRLEDFVFRRRLDESSQTLSLALKNLADEIRVTHVEVNIPHILLQPLLGLNASLEAYEVIKNLSNLMAQSPQFAGKLVTKKNMLYRQLVEFEKLTQGQPPEQRQKIFDAILTIAEEEAIKDKENPPSLSTENVEAFYNALLTQLIQYGKVAAAINSDSMGEEANRLLNSLVLRNHAREDGLAKFLDELSKLAAEELVDFFENKKFGDETLFVFEPKRREEILENLKRFAREDYAHQKDYLKRDIFQLIRLYLTDIDEREIWQNMLDALEAESKNDFSDWKSDSKGYHATLDAIIQNFAEQQEDTGGALLEALQNVQGEQYLHQKLESVPGYDEINEKVARIKSTLNQSHTEPLPDGKRVEFVRDFWNLFTIGDQRGYSSCQNCAGSGTYKQGLAGQVVNGTDFAIAIMGIDGEIVERRIVRLLMIEKQQDGKKVKEPVLYIEENTQFGSSYVEQIYALLKQIAQQSKLPVVIGTAGWGSLKMTLTGAIDATVILQPDRASDNYSDSLGAIVPFDNQRAAGLYRRGVEPLNVDTRVHYYPPEKLMSIFEKTSRSEMRSDSEDGMKTKGAAEDKNSSEVRAVGVVATDIAKFFLELDEAKANGGKLTEEARKEFTSRAEGLAKEIEAMPKMGLDIFIAALQNAILVLKAGEYPSATPWTQEDIQSAVELSAHLDTLVPAGGKPVQHIAYVIKKKDSLDAVRALVEGLASSDLASLQRVYVSVEDENQVNDVRNLFQTLTGQDKLAAALLYVLSKPIATMTENVTNENNVAVLSLHPIESDKLHFNLRPLGTALGGHLNDPLLLDLHAKILRVAGVLIANKMPLGKTPDKDEALRIANEVIADMNIPGAIQYQNGQLNLVPGIIMELVQRISEQRQADIAA